MELAGSTYIFSSPREACASCGIQQQHGHLVSDTTPITPILMDYIKIGQLASLEPEHVKPFLTDRLRWRVQKVSYISSVLPCEYLLNMWFCHKGKRQSRRPKKTARFKDLGQQQGLCRASGCRASFDRGLSGHHRKHHFQSVKGGRAYNGRDRAVNDNVLASLSSFELFDLCSVRPSLSHLPEEQAPLTLTLKSNKSSIMWRCHTE